MGETSGTRQKSAPTPGLTLGSSVTSDKLPNLRLSLPAKWMNNSISLRQGPASKGPAHTRGSGTAPSPSSGVPNEAEDTKTGKYHGDKSVPRVLAFPRKTDVLPTPFQTAAVGRGQSMPERGPWQHSQVINSLALGSDRSEF